MSKARTFITIQFLKIRYARWFGRMVSFVLLILGVLLFPFSRTQSAKLLMLSHRNSFTDAEQITRERILHKLNLLCTEVIDALLPSYEVLDEAIYRQRVITLKEPDGKEKGVILLKFLDTYSWFRHNHDLTRVLNDYYLALELSYYGTCRPEVLQFTSYPNTPIIVGAAVPSELGFLSRLNSNLIPSGYSSCTWVDDRTFFPSQAEKEYDCIMVATWSPVKRYFLLFEALTKINDPSYRALIIGGAYGGTRQEIEAQIKYYGVGDKVKVMEDVDQKDINTLLNKSRVNIMLSLKEGGNKAIIEGMLANTPGLIMSDHVGLDFGWINDQTGKVADVTKLEETLLWFKYTTHQFTPRAWVLEHISCQVSTQNLEKTVHALAKKNNEPWTRGLVIKYNRGSMPRYYNEKDVLSPFPFDQYHRKTNDRPVSVKS